MLKQLLTKAPLMAVLAAIIVFAIVAGAGLGLEWPLLAAVAASVFAVAQGGALWSLRRRYTLQNNHFKQIHFIADRFQSMLKALPGGYCLFTPQGLLREEQGVSAHLNVPRISHMEDLISAVKEGDELLSAFRRLQISGETFAMFVHANKDEAKRMKVMGRRFRIGPEGPHLDVLWFFDENEMRNEASQVAASLVRPTPSVTAQLEDSPNVAIASAEQVDIPKCLDVGAVRRCFDALPFPVWARNKELKLVLCNEAYALAIESQVPAVLSRQQELLPPSSKAGRALAEGALAKGEGQSERDHVVVQGRRCLLQITEQPYSGPVLIEGGDAIALFGFATDVTAEEEKETELRRHLVSHHEVLEHLGSAIGVYGPDTRLEFYNRAFVKLWDFSEGFLDSKPTFGELIQNLRERRKIPEQVDFQKYKKESLTLFTSLLEPHEDVLYLPDGTSLRVLVAPHPLGGLMYVYENVTDQLALETSYNTLMAVQKETLDNLAEGIAVFGPDGRLRLCNPALAKIWHTTPEEIGEQIHASEFFEKARGNIRAPYDWATYKAELVGYALDRKPHAGRLEWADHTVVDFITVPLPDGSVLNSYMDATDSVRVELALRAKNAALAQADRLKSDFVANVSYQLRTPLNTITGFAEILAEQYFGKLNERQLEYTTTIRAESEKLTRLINDVLDLATIEAGRMTLDQRPVSVANLLNEAKLMTAAWARQQMIEILIDCPSDIGTFEVDEQRMKQVLFNLISNAIKYTPAGGHIAMAAWKQDKWVVVSVLDTGVGIPEADKDRVFGKFEKSNNHLRQAGAGLGLSLVKSFVELHGGRVEIFSDEKDGTRVSCFIPQRAEKKELLPLPQRA